MTRIGALAVLLALGTGAVLVATPSVQSRSCTVVAPAAGAGAENPPVCTSSTTTLLESNGWGAVVAVAVPAVIALGALSRRHRIRTAAAVVLTLFCFVAGFSIGMFFLPAAALTIVAAARSGASSGGHAPPRPALPWPAPPG